MITKQNFKDLLTAFGFAVKNNIYFKKINGETIRVDFDKEQLIYPADIKVEGTFTTNFSSNENFVVFECVHQLLTLGYKPEHLTLEPKWKLGHGASGGRADIVIKDNDENVFAIIECKTAGKEFDDAWNLGLQYPSQLFSYAQQEGSTQLLCLYTSDFINEDVRRNYFIIPLLDNQSLLDVKDEDDVMTYEKAKRFDEKFNVWKNTYFSEAFTVGFFEEDIQPFHFGRKNYSVSDLNEISHEDIQKKYHQFATILRKYNVSGRENAFDKLVNLFLCKVVDEQQNPTNLSFYWKGRAYDDDFQLQDRLQRLYQQGMKQFLNEDVTYINQEQIDEAFRFLERDNDPDATKETINRYFKQLKFFTNNDFAFIDVHNERLFNENATVLRSIVEMLQSIRLKSESDGHSNQFLGDMFEGFLDAGVKQSEGQFFTPMPIVKFIINSLPLEDILIKTEQPPKAIDYACGAGHFLTELAMQLKPLVDKYKKADIAQYYGNITGVEKEYRLSKVAKVSAFMYGQDDINIIYADALARNAELQNGTYNILVANPPYSVKGFLETLKHTDRKLFELMGSVEEKSIVTNNSIETFFIERAKQLLAPDGVAAIILPSSVLSNDAQLYRQARQILLQHFHIIAIAELGSGTFGKTGTNTVTLFLRRRKHNPSEAEHFRYRAECWIMGGEVGSRTKKNKEYNDLHLLQAYCRHISIAYDDYKYFLQEEEPNEALQQTEIWQEYTKAFYDRADIKAHQRKPIFKRLSEKEQQAQLDEMLYQQIRRTELDKLYYYLLAQSNAVPVLVIKSPADNKAMKKFLGYEWSSAKGAEGIKYLNAAAPPADGEDEPQLVRAQLASIKTPLYNPADKNDAEKLNNYIIQNFLGKGFELPKSLSEYAHTIRLEDMLDFSRKDFTKAISLTSRKPTSEAFNKWPMIKLGDLAEVKNGATPDTNNPSFWDNGNIYWATLADTKSKYLYDTEKKITHAGLNGSSAQLLPINTVIFSSRATIGEVCINKVPTATNQGYKNFICDESKISHEFLYYILKQEAKKIEGLISAGTKYKEINSEQIKSYRIPLPPKDIQEKIVEECLAIDKATTEAQEEIKSLENEIEKQLRTLTSNAPTKKLSSIVEIISGGTPSTKHPEYWDGDIPWLSVADFSKGGRFVYETEKHITQKGLENSNARYLNVGEIIISARGTVGALAQVAVPMTFNQSCYGLRPNGELISGYLYYVLKHEVKQFKDNAAGVTFGAITVKTFDNIKIAVPPLSIQQQAVSEIEILEAQIANAQLTINNAPAQKAAILKKWLE